MYIYACAYTPFFSQSKRTCYTMRTFIVDIHLCVPASSWCNHIHLPRTSDKYLYKFVTWIFRVPLSSVYVNSQVNVNVDTHTFVQSPSTPSTYLQLSSCCHHLQLPLRYTCTQTCIYTHSQPILNWKYECVILDIHYSRLHSSIHFVSHSQTILNWKYKCEYVYSRVLYFNIDDIVMFPSFTSTTRAYTGYFILCRKMPYQNSVLLQMKP